MLFLTELEDAYDEEIEDLTRSHEDHCEQFLDEEFNLVDIKDSLKTCIVEIMSRHYQNTNPPNKVKARIQGLRVGKPGEDGSYLRDLILPYRYLPIYSRFIGRRDAVGLIKALEDTEAFSDLKCRLEDELDMEFKFHMDIQFYTDPEGNSMISQITWEPCLYFDTF